MTSSIFDLHLPHAEPSTMVAFAENSLDRRSEYRADDCVERAFAAEGVHAFAFAGGKLVVKHSGRGAVVLVHGYANDFDTAIDSCAIGAYKTRYEQLDRLPILFSWPARGNSITYERDTTFAQNSQRLFLDALHVILQANKKANKDVDLMAHSHGNELIVSALSDRKSKVQETPLRHLLLVEGAHTRRQTDARPEGSAIETPRMTHPTIRRRFQENSHVQEYSAVVVCCHVCVLGDGHKGAGLGRRSPWLHLPHARRRLLPLRHDGCLRALWRTRG